MRTLLSHLTDNELLRHAHAVLPTDDLTVELVQRFEKLLDLHDQTDAMLEVLEEYDIATAGDLRRQLFTHAVRKSLAQLSLKAQE